VISIDISVHRRAADCCRADMRETVKLFSIGEADT